MKQLIFGLGTGRCGTYSLAKLLDSQENSRCYHELLFCKWKGDEERIDATLSSLLSYPTDITGDVGFYYLNYIPYIKRKEPTSKFIVLQRDKEGVVESWDNHSGHNNHWDGHDPYFPSYDLPKREAIAKYWIDYYKKVKELILEYPMSVRIWQMKDVLNDSEVQSDMLSFVGIPKDKQVIKQVKLNVKQKPLIDHSKMPITCGYCSFCNQPDSASWYVKDTRTQDIRYACDMCKNGKRLGRFNLTEEDNVY